MLHPENEKTYNMEQDMRHVFDNALQSISTLRDKTISALISHSRQAQELEELKQKFSDMSARMDTVVQEAQRIRQDLHLTITERDKFKKEAEENLHLAQGYEKERDEARERVTALATSLHNAEVAESEAKRNLDHANALADRLRRDIDWTQESNKRLRDERDEAKSQVSKLEVALKEANDKLGTLQNTFKSLFPEAPKSLVDEAKPVEVPGVAPSFRSDYVTEGVKDGRLPNPVSSEPTHEPQPLGEGPDNVKEEPKTEDDHWWNKRPA